MAYPEDKQATINANTLTIFEYEAQVDRNQCHYRQLETFKRDLHSTAEVSGSVLTGSGRPVSRGWVYLVNAAYPADSELNKIENDGSFRFKSVAVGEYYLALNPHNEPPDETDAPYPGTYYPNAADASAATKIVVTAGVKLENLTLRLGSSWKGRDVTGKVVWPDGRPAQGAHIYLYYDNRFARWIKLDEKGRFSFKVYGDFKYAISAEVWRPNPGKSERLSLTEKSTGLKLILQHVQKDDFD